MTSKEALSYLLGEALYNIETNNKVRECYNIIAEELEENQKQKKMLKLLKKCYYASSINKAKTLHLTSYGLDNPLDVIKIGEWLDNEK